MKGDFHVRFCERFGVKSPRPTRQAVVECRRCAKPPGRCVQAADSVVCVMKRRDEL
jgi:hypothetical protein